MSDIDEQLEPEIYEQIVDELIWEVPDTDGLVTHEGEIF